MKEFFIMLHHPTLTIVPMIDIKGNIPVYESYDAAKKAVDASGNMLAEAYGYEIFNIYRGE